MGDKSELTGQVVHRIETRLEHLRNWQKAHDQGLPSLQSIVQSRFRWSRPGYGGYPT
jgi:hypothetical protein